MVCSCLIHQLPKKETFARNDGPPIHTWRPVHGSVLVTSRRVAHWREGGHEDIHSFIRQTKIILQDLCRTTNSGLRSWLKFLLWFSAAVFQSLSHF